MFICLSVCLYQMILFSAGPIWFSFTIYLLIGPWKVFFYLFWKMLPPPSQAELSLKNNPPPHNFFMKLNVEDRLPLFPKEPLEASRCVAVSI